MLTVLFFFGGLALLILGSELFTDAAVDAAKRLKVTTFLLALLVAGAEPEELVASAVASARGMGGLAVGNALGTNICIVALALALGAVITPIRVEKKSLRHGFITLAFSVPPFIFMLNLQLARWEGWFLMVAFFAYVWYVVTRERIDLELEEISTRELLAQAEGGGDGPAVPTATGQEDPDGEEEEEEGGWKAVGLVVLGLALMALGGDWLVRGAGGIIQLLGLSQTAVGLTLVSLATSAEMVVLSVVPLFKGHPEITVGGIIGSYAYNILLTLGVAAAVSPLALDVRTLTVDFPMMIAVLAVTLLWSRKGYLGRRDGLLLLLAYAAFFLYAWGWR